MLSSKIKEVQQVIARTKERVDSASHDELITILSNYEEELRSQIEDLSYQQQLIDEHEQFYASMFHEAPIGILIIDQTTNINDFNYRASTIFGKSNIKDQSFIGVLISAFRKNEDTYPWVLDLNHNSQDKGLILQRKTDSRWFEFKQSVVDNKRTIITISQVEDPQIRQEAEQAIQANINKSMFLANMSHELRTPMHAIRSFVKLALKVLDEGKLDKAKNYLSNVDISSERLLVLLNELLDLSKLEAGQTKITKTTVKLSDLIVPVLKELKELAHAKGITIEDQTTDAWIDVDHQQIYRVILNLVSNAIKYSPEHTFIQIRTHFDYGNVVVEVLDQGYGIPRGEHELIFKKFEQSSTTNTGAGGTGLGLAISKQIVELHGGRIWVDSPPEDRNLGSSFKFSVKGTE